MSERATTSNADEAETNEEQEARLRELINSDDIAFSSLTYEDLGMEPTVDDYISPFNPANFNLAPIAPPRGRGRGGRRRPRTMQPTPGLRTPPQQQAAQQPVTISNEGLDDLVLDEGDVDFGDGANNGGGGGDGAGGGGDGGGGGGDGGGGGGGGGGDDGGDDFDRMNDPGDNEYHDPFRYFSTRRDRDPNSIVEYRTVVVTYKNRARPLVLRARRERRIRPEENAAAVAQRGRGLGRSRRGSYRVRRGRGRGHRRRSSGRFRWR